MQTLLSVVVVGQPGDEQPDFARSIGARVTTDLADVRTGDDVVVLAGRDGGRRYAELSARLGEDTPPALVIAPALDREDLWVALEHGLTAYYLDSECLPYLDRAIAAAASRMSFPGACVASTLVRQVRTTRRAPLPAGWAELTPRERQIMSLAADGHAPDEIAGLLRLRTKTVRNNLSHVYAKLQVRGLSEAILVWVTGRERPPAL
jgi:DNA-binding NarL/FixJ family response regulator